MSTSAQGAWNIPVAWTESHPDDGRYRLLVEAVTDYAIYMLDPAGVVTSWNPGAQRFKGYKPAEIIGQHFSRFYTEEDRKAGLPARALETAAREGKFESEGWRVRKDGTRFWAYVVIDPIRVPSGELVGFAKITRDLTERKAAEEALRQSEEQFRLLVQGVTDYAIYMLDPEGIVTNWNPARSASRATARRNHRRSTSRNSTPLRIGKPASRNGRWKPPRARAGSKRKAGASARTARRFWANVVIDPIRDDRGELIGYAKITRDITERREAQRALEERARGAAAVAEDGSDRPAHRRRSRTISTIC